MIGDPYCACYQCLSRETPICPHGFEVYEAFSIREITECALCRNFLKRRGSRRRRQLYLLYEGRCFYCGKPLTLKNSTIDHWIPRSRGGANVISNMRLSCEPCNRVKDDDLPNGLPANWWETPTPDA